MRHIGTHVEARAALGTRIVPAVAACALSLSMGLVACAPAGNDAGEQGKEPEPTTDVRLSDGDQGTASAVTSVEPADVPDNRPPLAPDYVPEVPMVDEGHDEETIRSAISDFLAANHPDEEVRSIKLMGNGLLESQQKDGMGMWASFVVTLSTGDIGLSLTSTPSSDPNVHEISMIPLGNEEYYDVGTGEYIHRPAVGDGQDVLKEVTTDTTVYRPTEEEVRAMENSPAMQLEALVNDWVSAGADPNALPPELEPYRSELVG